MSSESRAISVREGGVVVVPVVRRAKELVPLLRGHAHELLRLCRHGYAADEHSHTKEARKAGDRHFVTRNKNDRTDRDQLACHQQKSVSTAFSPTSKTPIVLTILFLYYWSVWWLLVPYYVRSILIVLSRPTLESLHDDRDLLNVFCILIDIFY